MNEKITVPFAVEALQLYCSRGEVNPTEARELLAAFGGVPYEGKDGAEMYRFVDQPWDVEVMASQNRVILWRVLDASMH